MLKNHKDVLEPYVILMIFFVIFAIHLATQLGLNKEFMCSNLFEIIWPLNVSYSKELSILGVSNNNVCYVTTSISMNFLILIASFFIAFFNRIASGWLSTELHVMGRWPIKAAVFLFIVLIIIKQMNFTAAGYIFDLDINRPLWISVLIITSIIGIILMLLLHLTLILLKFSLKVLLPDKFSGGSSC